MLWRADILDAHQRARFMRPDAARYLRPDAARWARAVHPDERKYSPTQPRDERGRWTDGGGGSGTGSASPMGQINFGDLPNFSDLFGLFQISPTESDLTGLQLAQSESSFESIDLAEEEQIGGHAVAEHVGKSDSYLKTRVKEEASRIIGRGDDFRGLSVGSFYSFTSANRLVNSTIAKNLDIIDQLVSGERQTAFFEAEFGSATGYEAHLPRYHAEPYMRETNGVGVFVLKDPFAKKGWRVQSAYPKR